MNVCNIDNFRLFQQCDCTCVVIGLFKDCNRDGVTDCDDYAMLHFNLKDDCAPTLEGTNYGRRYASCRPKAEPPGSNFS